MKTLLFLGLILTASALWAVEGNDNGVTGEWLVHAGLPGEVHSLEVEFDPGGASPAGIVPDVGWTSALGFEMRGRSSTFDFATSTNVGSLWCQTGSTESFADVRLNVPHNARISFFRMWGWDSSTDTNLTGFLFESCLPDLSAGTPVNTILAQLTSSGTPNSFTETTQLASPQPVTNTRDCTYWARANFATNCPGGSGLILRKFRIQYALEN